MSPSANVAAAGAISPQTGWGCVAVVGIGTIGMIFIGMTVAVATRALADTLRQPVEH